MITQTSGTFSEECGDKETLQTISIDVSPTKDAVPQNEIVAKVEVTSDHMIPDILGKKPIFLAFLSSSTILIV